MTGAQSVRDWLAGLGLAQHAEVFEREQIDLEALRHLTEDNLKDLGLPMGHRIKLLAAIRALPAATAASRPQLPEQTPRSYTPAHLADKILTSRAAVEGERKQVTVLFCDIANSTSLAEQVGAEAMHALLSRFFERALEEVHRYEGTVNQFLGDGFMALFGAPVAHEDDARRGVLAALGIRRRLADSDAVPGLPAGATLSVRMGVHTGPVVVGSIGDNLRMDYTAIGDTTNLAARLQQAAQPGEILTSEVTARLVEGDASVEALPPLAVKGKSEPIGAWRVLAGRQRRSRLAQGRTLSPFVGREREIQALREALDEVSVGRGQVIGIVGEPGVGKSRLLYEFQRLLATREGRCLEGWCQSFGQSIPYLPLQYLVRAMCGITDADSAAETRAKLDATLQTAGMDPVHGTPYLLRMLGSAESMPELEHVSPEAIQARIRDNFVQVALACGWARTAVLAVEDLHWIDDSSEECLAALVESMAGSPLMLLTTTRPGYTPPWAGRSYTTQLALRPLASEAARAIVQATVERVELDTDQTDAILRKGEGNPLFLEELTLGLLDHRASDAVNALPDTIQGVLAARIDRLPEPAKRVMQTASVLGREFQLRLLEAVVDETARLPQQLAELMQHELLYQRTTAEGPLYAFKHALTQQVAYDNLLRVRREALHESAGHALETLYPTRLDEHCERIAHHYAHSSNHEKALEYLERADRRAIASNAVADAKNYFEQAMAALDALPDASERRHKRIALLVAQIHVYILTNKLDEYERLLQRFAPDAEALSDDALRGHFQSCLGHTQFGLARPRQAIRTLRPAAALCDRAGNFQGAGQAYVHLQWSHLQTGEFEETLRYEAPALAALDRAWDQRLRLYVFFATSWACCRLARWDMAAERAARALSECEASGDASLIASALGNMGMPGIHRGALDEAIEWTRRGVEHSVTPGDRAWAQLYYGWALATRAPGEAIALLKPLVQMWLHRWWFDSVALVALGEAYLTAGELAPARAALEQAIELSQPRDMQFMVAPAQRLLGEVLLAQGHLDQSDARFGDALALLERFRAENEIALVQAGLGRLRAQQGRREEARKLLACALETFERLGTVGQPERVRAQIGSLG
jgi:class 3 adenylate cyclase/tetratricopeptide (TPR) repeat protein